MRSKDALLAQRVFLGQEGGRVRARSAAAPCGGCALGGMTVPASYKHVARRRHIWLRGSCDCRPFVAFSPRARTVNV